MSCHSAWSSTNHDSAYRSDGYRMKINDGPKFCYESVVHSVVCLPEPAQGISTMYRDTTSSSPLPCTYPPNQDAELNTEKKNVAQDDFVQPCCMHPSRGRHNALHAVRASSSHRPNRDMGIARLILNRRQYARIALTTRSKVTNRIPSMVSLVALLLTTFWLGGKTTKHTTPWFCSLLDCNEYTVRCQPQLKIHGNCERCNSNERRGVNQPPCRLPRHYKVRSLPPLHMSSMS
jgi:hypothetical protein